MGDFLTHERSFKHASDQIVFCAFYSFLVEVHTKLAEQPRDYDCGLLFKFKALPQYENSKNMHFNKVRIRYMYN